jgi:putative flippase GtrA
VYSIFKLTILKFGVVGIAGMAIDFSCTWFCKEKLHWNKYLANSVGFSMAVVNNFILNRIWTFGNLSQPVGEQFLKFLLISCGGLLINNITLSLLIARTRKNFYLLKVIVIGIVFIWNYLMNYFYTFN